MKIYFKKGFLENLFNYQKLAKKKPHFHFKTKKNLAD